MREVEYIDSDLNGELGIVIKGVGIRVVFFRPKLAYGYGYGSLVIIRWWATIGQKTKTLNTETPTNNQRILRQLLKETLWCYPVNVKV